MESFSEKPFQFLKDTKKPKRRSWVATTSFQFAVPSCPSVHYVSLSHGVHVAGKNIEFEFFDKLAPAPLTRGTPGGIIPDRRAGLQRLAHAVSNIFITDRSGPTERSVRVCGKKYCPKYHEHHRENSGDKYLEQLFSHTPHLPPPQIARKR